MADSGMERPADPGGSSPTQSEEGSIFNPAQPSGSFIRRPPLRRTPLLRRTRSRNTIVPSAKGKEKEPLQELVLGEDEMSFIGLQNERSPEDEVDPTEVEKILDRYNNTFDEAGIDAVGADPQNLYWFVKAKMRRYESDDCTDEDLHMSIKEDFSNWTMEDF